MSQFVTSSNNIVTTPIINNTASTLLHLLSFTKPWSLQQLRRTGHCVNHWHGGPQPRRRKIWLSLGQLWQLLLYYPLSISSWSYSNANFHPYRSYVICKHTYCQISFPDCICCSYQFPLVIPPKTRQISQLVNFLVVFLQLYMRWAEVQAISKKVHETYIGEMILALRWCLLTSTLSTMVFECLGHSSPYLGLPSTLGLISSNLLFS